MSPLNQVETEWHPATEEEQRSVREQLERVLASSLFRNSKRYPALLRFVVEQSLDGNQHLLKERLLGIDVFHRPPDYDTNQDTVVRLTAAEVRKRIAQYYQQPEHRNELRIHLNSGSYVPHFIPPTAEIQPAARHLDEASAPSDRESAATADATPRRRPWFWVAGALILTLSACGLLLDRAGHLRQNAGAAVWRPILSDPNPVLFVLPDLSQAGAAGRFQQDENTNLLDHLRRGRIVDFGDSVAMSRLATYLTREGKEFEVQLSSEVSYTRLQQGPAIFVGGLDNPWTMRVLEPLRFHMERSGGTMVYRILDRQRTDAQHWSVDLAQPFSNMTVDYAIIASVHDKTTGRPILVVAGLGANGTTAAASLLIDPAYTLQLEQLIPRGWKKGNMELVIQTQVIDDKAGPPQVVAQTFW